MTAPVFCAQYKGGALHGTSINWREDGQVQSQVVFHRGALQSGDDKTPARVE